MYTKKVGREKYNDMNDTVKRKEKRKKEKKKNRVTVREAGEEEKPTNKKNKT